MTWGDVSYTLLQTKIFKDQSRTNPKLERSASLLPYLKFIDYGSHKNGCHTVTADCKQTNVSNCFVLGKTFITLAINKLSKGRFIRDNILITDFDKQVYNILPHILRLPTVSDERLYSLRRTKRQWDHWKRQNSMSSVGPENESIKYTEDPSLV